MVVVCFVGVFVVPPNSVNRTNSLCPNAETGLCKDKAETKRPGTCRGTAEELKLSLGYRPPVHDILRKFYLSSPDVGELE